MPKYGTGELTIGIHGVKRKTGYLSRVWNIVQMKTMRYEVTGTTALPNIW